MKHLRNGQKMKLKIFSQKFCRYVRVLLLYRLTFCNYAWFFGVAQNHISDLPNKNKSKQIIKLSINHNYRNSPKRVLGIVLLRNNLKIKIMKIIGLRVEKYIDKGISGHNCDFEYTDEEFEKHILCAVLSNNEKVEIQLSNYINDFHFYFVCLLYMLFIIKL